MKDPIVLAECESLELRVQETTTGTWFETVDSDGDVWSSQNYKVMEQHFIDNAPIEETITWYQEVNKYNK